MSKYNEIMERLTVSDRMKEEMIASVGNAEANKRGTWRRPVIMKIAAIAACLALVFIGIIIVKNTTGNKVPVPAPTGGDYTGGAIDQNYGPTEYKNAAELSEAAKIEIKDLEYLPFQAKETVYQLYADGVAEIAYSNGEDSLYYRVSKGDGDNSGDYNDYPDVYQRQLGGTSFTLKGDGDLIYCALYQKSGYSYSITSTNGFTVEQLEKMH
ncbi:MAG: hypothetical protein J5585_00215 [Clostridia bacterium]|nr:hypothetical protein [Clostridia bacterium]